MVGDDVEVEVVVGDEVVDEAEVLDVVVLRYDCWIAPTAKPKPV